VYVLELAGEDDPFAAREARSAATAVELRAPGLATARGIDPRRARGLAYTRRASRLLGRCGADVGTARALLDAAALDRRGTVAVRARDVRSSTGIDTQRAERELGAALADRGFAVDLDDPDHELRALFSGDACLLGWLDVESRRDFGARAPTEKPFFQPGAMDPLLARALVNVVGARPGVRLCDPMCGTGGVLVEAGLVGADVAGIDAQAKMVRGARHNLERYLGAGGRSEPAASDDGDGPPITPDDGDGSPVTPDESGRPPSEFAVLRGDAAGLPLADGAVDGVIFDAPYGRQSAVRGDLASLVAGALSEARRVSGARGTTARAGTSHAGAARAVVVGDRSWADAAREVGWTVESAFERRVHRSLTRHVLVLE
jgi:tRNA (guanine10-N2)-dimethyltransferase